ncbi:hypothetical protein [Novosphingobium sp. 9U]|uniref:hypothetical protein n=1 Tax=Novosphingobium sp. 9U TaxID=2653158 RepID=UPI0012F155D1|nr:hypothetical protein [Novosphingobium sp. 9U]VWX46627.1 hypothetical protein NOVOSPHI9U_10167 [Novosphingobium sp. 9U]
MRLKNGDRDARADELLSALATARLRRAAVSHEPTSRQHLKIKDCSGGGYISTAELACRFAERAALDKALKSCRTPEEHSGAVQLLQVGTPSFERRKALQAFLRDGLPEIAATSADAVGDPFAAALAPWDPTPALAQDN